MQKSPSRAAISSRFSSETEIQILKELGSSKAQVMLVYLPKEKRFCALKLFVYEDNQISSYYINESRFSSLSHPHLISFIHTANKYEVTHKNRRYVLSSIMMELGRYGDLSFIINDTGLFQDEVLVRTYFHQLVEGVEYLHSRGIAHLDLKPDNLLLGEDLRLKITDFDAALMENDNVVHGKGTTNYRSPEIKKGDVSKPKASDIYSLGVTLFVMKTGFFPYIEDSLVDGYDLETLMKSNPAQFWKAHTLLHDNLSEFNQEFQDLFLAMVCENPAQRIGLEPVKKSAWYKGPVYTQKELKKKLIPVINQCDILKSYQC